MKLNFKKTIVALTLLTGIPLLCIKCKSEEKPKEPVSTKGANTKEASNNLNISILLDLSDRINPTKYPSKTMDFYKRDIGYIESVSTSFDSFLRSKKTRTLNDKISIFFEPAPLNEKINSLSESLKYHFTRDNTSKELLKEFVSKYKTIPQKFYELAITDDKYIGSDIWGFFKSKVDVFCMEENARNIVVVLTDGYIYHSNNKIQEDNYTSYLTPQTIRKNSLNKSSWKQKMDESKFGYLPTGKELSDVEVLVLGLNPSKSNPYELDVLKKYWSDWLENMGVKKYEIHQAFLPSNMDKVIEKFIMSN